MNHRSYGLLKCLPAQHLADRVRGAAPHTVLLRAGNLPGGHVEFCAEESTFKDVAV